MTVGFDTVFTSTANTVFVVQNVAQQNKRIRVFNYPINNGETRDLMKIPYVSEADIRHSLLKGELFAKIITGEIIVLDSNIDLLQFDPTQKQFLINAGVNNGLSVSGGGGPTDYLFRQNVTLFGLLNNVNRVFMIPGGEKFINGTFEGNDFFIEIYHNGRRLVQEDDYIVSESIVGQGYDTIQFVSFIPNIRSIITADYVVQMP
jgi:hypothetical protein